VEESLDIKEAAVKERRLWVRLNRVCNNACLFCLDSGSHDGFQEPRESIERQLANGRD